MFAAEDARYCPACRRLATCRRPRLPRLLGYGGAAAWLVLVALPAYLVALDVGGWESAGTHAVAAALFAPAVVLAGGAFWWDSRHPWRCLQCGGAETECD
jgi:hypothetical protein